MASPIIYQCLFFDINPFIGQFGKSHNSKGVVYISTSKLFPRKIHLKQFWGNHNNGLGFIISWLVFRYNIIFISKQIQRNQCFCLPAFLSFFSLQYNITNRECFVYFVSITILCINSVINCITL